MEILLVEDDLVAAQSIREILHNKNYHLSHARNEIQAKNIFLKYNPQICIVDIRLSKTGEEGLLLANEFSQYGVSIILLSGYHDEQTIRLGVNNQYSILSKPITPEQLYITILEAIEKRRIGNNDNKRLQFTSRKRKIIILAQEICHISSMDNVCTVFTKCDNYVISESIGVVHELIESIHCLVRVHRSHIVNLNCVTSKTTNTLYLDKIRVPIGRKYKEEVITFFQSKDFK